LEAFLHKFRKITTGSWCGWNLFSKPSRYFYKGGYFALSAQLAGVNQGDELLEVAGSSVGGKTAFEAASLIQGPKGTKVSIKVGFGLNIKVFTSVEPSVNFVSCCIPVTVEPHASTGYQMTHLWELLSYIIISSEKNKSDVPRYADSTWSVWHSTSFRSRASARCAITSVLSLGACPGFEANVWLHSFERVQCSCQA
jgi:hypothetical protein